MADLKSQLSAAEEATLRRNVVERKIADAKYLRAHPEIGAVLSEVTREVLMRRPEEPVAFAEDYLATQDLHAVYARLKEEAEQREMANE